MKKKVLLAASSAEQAMRYTPALEAAGLEVLACLPGTETVVLDEVSGLVVTGGGDIDPALYGAKADPRTRNINTERDTSEIALIKEAVSRNLPVLAICRGMQLLNVAFGGVLIQHIDGHNRAAETDETLAHSVTVKSDTQLSVILQGVTTAIVNSMHHQAVQRPGQGLTISAYASDGTCEAVEMSDRNFVVGVQWHPERDYQQNRQSRLLFYAFADSIDN